MSYSNQNTRPQRPGSPVPGQAPTPAQGQTAPPAKTGYVAPPKAKPALTEKQLAWSQAFMRAMGMTSDVDVKVVQETAATGIKGNLSYTDQKLDRQMGDSLQTNSGVKGSGEKVGRGLLHGAGRGYKADVTEKVNTVLKRANALASKGTVSTEIKTLINELTKARDGYEEREAGEEDKAKLDQRQRKVAAIDDRILALQGMLDDAERTKVIEVTHMSDAEKAEALVANPAILATVFRKDPKDPRVMAAVQKLAKDNPGGFSDSPEMFDAYLKSKPPVATEIVGVLAAAEGTASDALADLVMKSFGGNAKLMNTLCKGIVDAETGKQASTSTFFRGNTAATKLTKAFAQSGAESKAYLDDVADIRNQVLAQAPKRVEIDATRTNTNDAADLVEKSIVFVKQSCDTILAALYRMKVPANVATTAAMIATAARSKNLKQEEVATMVGGHLLLRVINPLLTQTKKPGDVALAADEQRLINLVTKVMQNISNHVVTTKEPYMEGLTSYTKTKMPEMDQWCLAVANQGAAILGSGA